MKHWMTGVLILVAAAVIFWFGQPDRWTEWQQDQRVQRCELIEASLSYIDEKLRSTEPFEPDLSDLLTPHGPVQVDFQPESWSGLICDDQPQPVYLEWNRVIFAQSDLSGSTEVYDGISVGFGPSEFGPLGQSAWIEFSYFCGGLCGQGWRFHLEQSENTWQVVRVEHAWIS